MATWNDLRNYITSKYKIKDDQGNLLRLGFNLDGGRAQDILIVDGGKIMDSDWAVVETAVAEQGQISPRDLLVHNAGLKAGTLGVYDNGIVVFRYSVRLNDLDAGEIEDALRIVTLTGDEFESILTGSDTF